MKTGHCWQNPLEVSKKKLSVLLLYLDFSLPILLMYNYMFRNHFLYSPRANGAKRRSGRKPGARVTNFVLAEFKVVARDR